jgi:hypothetical protein
MDGADRTVLVRPPLDRHRHPAETDGADLDLADTSSLHDYSLFHAPARVQQKKPLGFST